MIIHLAMNAVWPLSKRWTVRSAKVSFTNAAPTDHGEDASSRYRYKFSDMTTYLLANISCSTHPPRTHSTVIALRSGDEKSTTDLLHTRNKEQKEQKKVRSSILNNLFFLGSLLHTSPHCTVAQGSIQISNTDPERERQMLQSYLIRATLGLSFRSLNTPARSS